MLIKKKKYYLSKDLDFLFFQKSSYFFIKSYFGTTTLNLPSFYFYFIYNNYFSFIFLSKIKFFNIFSNFLNCYKSLFLLNFVKVKIRGLGYRIKKISSNLYRFFFGFTNYIYFHIPENIVVQIKKRRMLLISNNLVILKTILAQLLLLKKLSIYFIRGLVYPHQIFLLKSTKKSI